jgi:hypothetical protein
MKGKFSFEAIRVTEILIAGRRYGGMVVLSAVKIKATTDWETIHALAVTTEGIRCLYW